jgi:hypothetical protein
MDSDAADAAIVPASPRARKMAFALFALALLVGGPLLYLTRNELGGLTALARTDRRAALAGFERVVLPQLVAVAAIGVAAGLWTIRQGTRAYRAGQYPLPGMLLLHDTPVRRGRDARRIAVLLTVVGATVALVPTVLVIALLTVLWRYG